MTSTAYNLTGIHDIFWSAYKSNDEILAFEIVNGRGRFVFMCFFDTSKAKKKMKDTVYIYMTNTRHIISKVMYGSHRYGDYKIYLDRDERQMFRDELQIEQAQGGREFDFDRFFNDLNAAIPATLPIETKTQVIRTYWYRVSDHVREEIPFYERSVLIGPKKITNGQPRYRTLSKLYMFTDGTPETVGKLIHELVKRGITLSWTTPGRQARSASLTDVMRRISTM